MERAGRHGSCISSDFDNSPYCLTFDKLSKTPGNAGEVKGTEYFIKETL